MKSISKNRSQKVFFSALFCAISNISFACDSGMVEIDVYGWSDDNKELVSAMLEKQRCIFDRTNFGSGKIEEIRFTCNQDDNHAARVISHAKRLGYTVSCYSPK